MIRSSCELCKSVRTNTLASLVASMACSRVALLRARLPIATKPTYDVAPSVACSAVTVVDGLRGLDQKEKYDDIYLYSD